MQATIFTNQRILNWFLPIVIIVYSLLYAPLIAVQGFFHPNQVAVSIWVSLSTWLILGVIGGKLIGITAYKPRIWNLLDGISSCAVLWASLRMYSLAKEDVVPALTLGKLLVLAIAVAIDGGLAVVLREGHKEKARLHTLRWHYLAATFLALIAIGLNFVSSKLRINQEALKLVSVYAGAYAFKILLASIPKHLRAKRDSERGYPLINTQIDLSAPTLPDVNKHLIDDYKARFAYLIYSQLATTTMYVILCFLTEKREALLAPSAISAGFITTIVGACSATILMHPLAHSACIPLNKLGSLIGAKIGNLTVFVLSGLALRKGFTAKDYNLLLGFLAIGLLIIGEIGTQRLRNLTWDSILGRRLRHKWTMIRYAWRKRFHAYRLARAIDSSKLPTDSEMGSRIW